MLLSPKSLELEVKRARGREYTRKSRASARQKADEEAKTEQQRIEEEIEKERARNRKKSQAHRDRQKLLKQQQPQQQQELPPELLKMQLLSQELRKRDETKTQQDDERFERRQDRIDADHLVQRNETLKIFGEPTKSAEELQQEMDLMRFLRNTPMRPTVPRLPLTEPARTVAASLPIPKDRSATPFVFATATVTPMVGEVAGDKGKMSPRQLSDPRQLFGAPLQSPISNFGGVVDNRKMAPSNPNPFAGGFSIGRGDSCTPSKGVWNSQDLHKNRLASFGRSRTSTHSKRLSKSSVNRSVNRDKRRRQQQNNASALIPPTPLFATPVPAKPTDDPNPPQMIPEPPSSVFRMASPTIQQPQFKIGDKIIFTKANNGVNTRRKGEIVYIDTSMGQPYSYYFDCYNHDGTKIDASTDDVGKLELFQG